METRSVQQRPDKEQPAMLAFGSQAVHAGNVIDATTGAIRTPIVMANSYRLPDDPSSLGWSDSQTLSITEIPATISFASSASLRRWSAGRTQPYSVRALPRCMRNSSFS